MKKLSNTSTVTKQTTSTGKKRKSSTSSKSQTRATKGGASTAKALKDVPVKNPTKKATTPTTPKVQACPAEKDAVALCRAFKKAIKDGTVDERWDEIYNHHVFTFKGFPHGVFCVSRYVDGRKKRYELHLNTLNLNECAEVSIDTVITGFDYEHTVGKIRLIFTVDDSHEVCYLVKFVD